MTADPQRVISRASIDEWTPDSAEQVASEAGLTPLGPLHWMVITLYREEHARTGVGPALERLASLCRFSAADLRALFPGETERLLARIAGSPLGAGRVVISFPS